MRSNVHEIEDLERGRESYARRAWAEAYESLSRADRAAPLGADDLDLLAVAAHMLGHEDEWASLLEREHQMLLEDGEPLRAIRCAFWLSLNLTLRGETARATGWLGRAQRLLQRAETDCAERGYLLIPVAVRHEVAGEYKAAHDSCAEAAAIGERFGDADLFALALHAQGTALIKWGRVDEGLALLDEAMVAVTGGRAVADDHRDRLLQRDRGLPATSTPCGAPRSGPAHSRSGARHSPTWSPSPGAA